MTQHHHDRVADAQMSIYRLSVFNRDSLDNFLQRCGCDLGRVNEICPEPLKMTAHKPAQFTWRFFIAESNRDVAPRKSPIFAEHDPCAPAAGFAERKQRRPWQNREQGRAGAIKDVNTKLQHSRRRQRLGRAAAERSEENTSE